MILKYDIGIFDKYRTEKSDLNAVIIHISDIIHFFAVVFNNSLYHT